MNDLDFYKFAEMSLVFDLPIERDWNLNDPVNRIEFVVAVLKLWEERK